MPSIQELLEQQEEQQEPIVANYYDPEVEREQSRQKKKLKDQRYRTKSYFFKYVLEPCINEHKKEGACGPNRSNIERDGSIIRSCLDVMQLVDDKFIIKVPLKWQNNTFKKYSALLKESGIDKIEFFK